MKRIIKYIRNIFIIVLSILVIIIGFSQTHIFKNILRDKITNVINNSIEGQVLIDRISGNLLSNIEIENIHLIKDNSPIISVKKISINYNPFALINQIIKINSLTIDSINFNLVQVEDSAWNISKVFKSTDDTSSTAFGWKVFLEELKIKNSNISFIALDSTSNLPKRIKDIYLEIAGYYTSHKIKINFKKLSFNTVNPSISVMDFRFLAFGSADNIDISDMVLETLHNKIYLEGNIHLETLNEFEFNARTAPINTSEFYAITAFRFNRFSPSLSIKIKKKDEHIFLESSLIEENQSVIINANLYENDMLEGSANIKFTNLNLADIIEDNSIDGLINGHFNIKGNWNHIDDSHIELKGKLFNSFLFQRKILDSEIFAQLQSDSLKLNVNLSGNFGSVYFITDCDKIFSEPSYSYHSNLKDLNLSKLLFLDSLDSGLNLMIDGEGKSFDPDNMYSNIKITSTSYSRIHNTGIDSLSILVTKDKGHYFLDSLVIKNSGNIVTANGLYEKSGSINSDIRLVLNNLENIKPYVNSDTLNGSLIINGELSGLLDSLIVSGKFNLNNFQYDNLKCNSLNGKANAVINNSDIKGKYDFLIDSVKYGDIIMWSLNAVGNYADSILNSKMVLKFSDSVNTEITSSVIFDSTIKIIIPNLSVKNGEAIWRNKNGPMNFLIYRNNYALKNFNLQNDSAYILIDAEIKDDKKLSADININSIELKTFLENLNLKQKMAGLLNIKMKADGDIDNPELNGELQLKKITLDQINLNDLTAGFKLKEKNISLDLSLTTGQNKLNCFGQIPINFPPYDTLGLINENKKFELTLHTENYDISSVKAVSNYFDKINGIFNCNISIKNNLINPQLEGTLNLTGADIQINKLGVDYRNINLNLKIDSNKIKLETASLLSGKGKITISGNIGSKTNIFKGDFKDVNVNLLSSNFELLNMKGSTVIVDGNFRLFSENKRTSFYGDIEIPRSSFYLSSKTQPKLESAGSDAPLLLQAVSQNAKSKYVAADSHQVPSRFLTFVKDINGKIKIRIPDNTWVKNPNFNIELKGDIIVEKIKNDFLLTGIIKTGRGNLYLYGKKFTVTDGEIIFNGEKDINPFVNINIEYVFRNPVKEKERININITNTINNPRLTYTHNDVIISEGDLVSYIIFGTRMEDLTQGQQSEIGSNEKIFSNIVTGMLASQLSSKLGNKIGLDVLEISGEENWEKASLIVGKYITNNLFVSYEHDIPLGNSNETEIKKLNFEYELLPFLFLQLIGGNSTETGINFILKFD